MPANLVPVLAKLAIPLGVGLLFVAARKGKKEDETTARAEDLTRRAVQAMQMANAQLLGMAANEFRADDADPTTAGLLDFQKGRMVARGTRGFTTVPEWTDDKSLAVDNREIAVRLVQLEGRAKALDAWAQAYDTVGAKNLAKQLRTKAAALRGVTNPKDEKAAKKAADKDKKRSADKKAEEKADKTADIVKQVTDALASGSVETMRKLADKLRSQGYTEQAESLDRAANDIEAELKAREDLRRRNEEAEKEAETDTKKEEKESGKKKADKPDPGHMGDSLTKSLITMLLGKSPGQEDTFLVKKWQTAQGRTADGKYGPGDAFHMAEKLGVVPPSPLYWPKNNTQKALTAWHQEMSRFSVERPSEANGYIFADKAGYQPGFEGMTAKIVSRRYNDGLGPLPTKAKSSGGSSTSLVSTKKTTRPTIRKGSKGEDVRYLQTRLAIVPADGDFGPKTLASVQTFQKSQGLEPDGIVGPKTWAAVEALRSV